MSKRTEAVRGLIAWAALGLLSATLGCSGKEDVAATKSALHGSAAESAPAAPDRDASVKKPAGPATLQTGLTMLENCAIDIGRDSVINPHKEGVLAKDEQGNLWVSRKISSAPDSKLGFFPKEGS